MAAPGSDRPASSNFWLTAFKVWSFGLDVEEQIDHADLVEQHFDIRDGAAISRLASGFEGPSMRSSMRRERSCTIAANSTNERLRQGHGGQFQGAPSSCATRLKRS